MPDESTTPDLVELLGKAFEAAKRRDLDAVASSFAEDATFDGRALGDHFEGRAAIRGFLDEWFGAYEELDFELEEASHLGGGVLFAVLQDGRLVGSAGRIRQREGMGLRLGTRLDRTHYDLRGRRGPAPSPNGSPRTGGRRCRRRTSGW
jgi:ketosteroid isomerase-like protein